MDKPIPTKMITPPLARQAVQQISSQSVSSSDSALSQSAKSFESSLDKVRIRAVDKAADEHSAIQKDIKRQIAAKRAGLDGALDERSDDTENVDGSRSLADHSTDRSNIVLNPAKFEQSEISSGLDALDSARHSANGAVALEGAGMPAVSMCETPGGARGAPDQLFETVQACLSRAVAEPGSHEGSWQFILDAGRTGVAEINVHREYGGDWQLIVSLDDASALDDEDQAKALLQALRSKGHAVASVNVQHQAETKVVET